MTTYAVGDLQGCLEPLQSLLKTVGFSPDRDRLWLVGDLINRGPANLATLRWLYDRRDNITAVLGNHDLHLLAVVYGATKPGKSDNIQEVLEAPDRHRLLEWLQARPLLHHEHEHTLVHAGIPPQWSLAQARVYAEEVQQALRDQPDVYFASMYGNQPDSWSDHLSSPERWRVITNYFTRMRFCTAAGRLDLKSKGIQPQKPSLDGEILRPWFAHAGRQTRNERIIFGHWAALNGNTLNPRVIGLDTGCVWGGAMTVYALETREYWQCACQNGRPLTAERR